MKNEKGITLIALVITIIVMIILVSVSVSIATNGGLFTYAGKAAMDTERERVREQDLGSEYLLVNTNEGEMKFGSIDEYIEDMQIPRYNVTISGALGTPGNTFPTVIKEGNNLVGTYNNIADASHIYSIESITVGGTTLTNRDYTKTTNGSTVTVEIPNVTGDVIITFTKSLNTSPSKR